MLTIARTLMGNPTLLLRRRAGRRATRRWSSRSFCAEALREFKRAGLSILLAEQSLALAAARSPTAPVVLESGQLRYAGPYARIRPTT